jgi:hypothetical protein
MNKFLRYSLFLILSGLVACESSMIEDKDPDNGNGSTFNCDNFSYSDTIFYINAAAENKIIPVQNNLNGQFTAFPEGLQIDPVTGEIDINKSETGLKYKVTFSPASSTETTCEFELIVAGINYLDKIYILDQNDSLAIPIFNSNQAALSPCDDDDDDDDDDEDSSDDTGDDSSSDDDSSDDDSSDDDSSDDDYSCKFDELGPDSTKLADLGIEVNTATGVIDLKKTLENKAFGENPQNGSTIDARMYYALQDNSLGALNGIDLRIFYFNTLNDIPQSLLDELEEKKSGILSHAPVPYFENARIMANNPRTKPRPPYLIIVASLQ